MPNSIAVIMDPISAINIAKDSTFAMLLEANKRNWNISYMEQKDIFAKNGRTFSKVSSIKVKDDFNNWFSLGESKILPLDQFDVILMRKDPPFDIDYIYTTLLLDQPFHKGSLVVNNPKSLRNINEKLAVNLFPGLCVPTIVTSKKEEIDKFIHEQKEVIIKPLDGMGGQSIFHIDGKDKNKNVILESLTLNEKKLVMVQRYIPEIAEGDKRILIIDGKPIPYALARIPQNDDPRGNLAKGALAKGVELNERDIFIVNSISAFLKKEGIIFAGIDVIGNFLTEINITSPTCIRELDKIFEINISEILFDCIEKKINNEK